jgi:hypothetical protein
VHITPREDLLGTHPPVAAATGVALPTRCDGRNHDLLSYPLFRAFTCFDDRAADFVTEGQGEPVPSRYAFVVEAQVRVAHSAAGDLDEGLFRPGLLFPFLQDHRLPALVNRPC